MIIMIRNSELYIILPPLVYTVTVAFHAYVSSTDSIMHHVAHKSSSTSPPNPGRNHNVIYTIQASYGSLTLSSRCQCHV